MIITRLGDSVRVKQEGIAVIELNGGFIEVFGVINSQRETPDRIQRVDRSVPRAPQQRWRMARVGISKSPPVRLVNPEECRDEAIERLAAQLPVGEPQQCRRSNDPCG